VPPISVQQLCSDCLHETLKERKIQHENDNKNKDATSTRLELVVVGIKRWDLGLETLALTDLLDEFLKLAGLLKR